MRETVDCFLHGAFDPELKRCPSCGAGAELLAYMGEESERRWCASWIDDLHLALKGDATYDRLVGEAGGHWVWDDDAPPLGDDLNVRFVKGAP